MMISPEVYIDEKKNWSLQELYKERDEQKIIRIIQKLILW